MCHIEGTSWPGLRFIFILFCQNRETIKLNLITICQNQELDIRKLLTKEVTFLGRLTLTNYALSFEASGVITYEDALKIDLSRDIDHRMKPAATGPWGAPLFHKAIF